MQFLRGNTAFGERQQLFQHGVPKNEAGLRANVAAALATFENELPGSVFHKTAQQGGRGNVKISPNSPLFQAVRLVRPAAGNDGKRGAEFMHRFELFRPQVRRNKAEDADAPGQSAQQSRRLLQKSPHLRTAHQRQRQERQSAVFGHRVCEGRLVAHPRHGSLQDGILGAVRNGERRAWPERLVFRRKSRMFPNRFVHGVQDSRHVVVTIRQRSGKRRVLSERPDVSVVRSKAHSGLQRAEPLFTRIWPTQPMFQRFQFTDCFPTRLFIDAEERTDLLAQANGFAAIGSGKSGTDRLRDARLRRQQNL